MKFKLLQVASANIVDTKGGMHLRNYHLARQLAQAMEVTHVGFGTPAEMEEPTLRRDGIRIVLAPKPRAYTISKLAQGAVGPMPVTLLNFYNTKMAAALRRELDKNVYNTVLIEGIEMVPYLPAIRAAKHPVKCVVLDWHNIESELVTRHSVNVRTPLHRLYMRRAITQLKGIETELLATCDLHLVTSAREQEALLSRQPNARILVVENGVDAEYFSQLQPNGKDDGHRRDRILFVGAMDYSANIAGAIYFADQVWPRIRQTFPELRFTIVGRNPPPLVQALASRPGIEVTGTVPDVRPFYRGALAAVVPLRVGGGTRLKILEAMAAGVPVVSTRVGAEGLGVEPETHFLEAEAPANFCAQVIRLRQDYDLWWRLSEVGRKLVESTYDWGNIGSQLAQTYVAQLRNSLNWQEARKSQAG